jgi:hypothetical protein
VFGKVNVACEYSTAEISIFSEYYLAEIGRVPEHRRIKASFTGEHCTPETCGWRKDGIHKERIAVKY